MAKITPRKAKETIVVKTMDKPSASSLQHDWWNAGAQRDMATQLISTASFLKTNQAYRFRQAAIYARMYGNLPLMNFIGSNISKMSGPGSLPIDRPTFNVVQSCVDTKVSRITQSRPRPVFLTDNGDYKNRTLAKQMNSFINGELYQTGAYKLGEFVLRDADVIGTGCVKVTEDSDKKVSLERRLVTELLVDANDALYGKPRCLYEFKLIDRALAASLFPKSSGKIESAQQAFPDLSKESSETVSDQVMLVEAWRLPTSKEANDGMHAIACSSGLIDDENWSKNGFPFAFLHSSPRLLGMWGQGCPERLMGIQVEINKLLITISKSINLVGVPRVFVEDGSKVVKAHLNNEIGSVITYRGTKPAYEIAPCVPQEVYAQLQRLKEYGYQQEGISELAASSIKPAGLDSGEAQREYNNNQSDRLAALSKRYDNFFIDCTYLIIDKAIDIAERDGKYQTVFPSKDSTKEINLPEIAKLKDNPFVIQCYDSSSLPRDPAGRKQEIIEMMQAGLINPQEGRRLLDFPDLEQENKLANAGEERILKYLDAIVESGDYTPPDPFMDIDLAITITTQYYNLYEANKLEESKAELLRNFYTQLITLKQASQPPPMPMQAGSPQAVPEAPPVSDLIPNSPQQSNVPQQ
jgi:hypothetical protein